MLELYLFGFEHNSSNYSCKYGVLLRLNRYFTDMQGNVLGTHKGLIHYTIGQRKGLGVAVGHPVYVCRINAENNTVTLGENEDLYTDSVTARRVNLITDLRKPVRVLAKIRYRHKEQPAAAWQDADGLLHVQFDEPQRAVTKGQAVVLYDGDTVIGGGIIRQSGK